MRKLIVTEALFYEFEVPDSITTEKQAEEWFCNLDNPVQAATDFAVNERACTFIHTEEKHNG